ncbi:MAG: Glu-tRNA(Gln) amidotransferase subunit GatE [Bacteroidetes bacterium]|jgi:glutamyl-tRNA(Gln) amidotransferase subunit E|nr:Glu-tRNA(Gln) amidotransferase subunit GatE [Bacteroidota bacterium]MBT6835531.1 Glu-tRNA(Gln) amidotransferase subunit GatE [Bacteroidota bacterium]MBT7144868.1 Glu-tRNA(Gln) amidotransferase subunit GatE [Bacteroidota bacterium]MBT7492459.1 Glu-tRNA(Gln) amidotransferase subunit GatE [Bacteroidota bacterium]
MEKKFDAVANYQLSRKEIGYLSRKDAANEDYKRIGFMSGLEVHQQLDTKRKLFCHCPAGIYHQNDDYNAEVIRHMRPTLSELGEYDGTALMEFKTKKEIVYRINNKTACTYEVDDTPPFKIDREALEKALEISILSKLNIVGEVHITRKQYLDGSIPTGFQRTAILGVEGEIQLKNKKVRLIQLSIEEDSCREISDVGHTRVYKTDRLGMPLIETVTYPDCETPDELMEAAQYIRFLNRSTEKVRVGMGAGREDVNVSCAGGTRVEIKGVAHNKWIPELSHNEAFRQWALLRMRDKLLEKIKNPKNWKIDYKKIDSAMFESECEQLNFAKKNRNHIYAVNLPNFKGALSHFTQPDKIFADEITNRLKVIACIEKPNMIHSEELTQIFQESDFKNIRNIFNSGKNDAQIIFWGPKDDIETALETIEERCQMALAGIPNETRKSFADGTTIFERVLPGADRMYPDTDSAPIPLENDYIENLRKNIPIDISERYAQMQKWEIPEDTFFYILRNNLVPLIERISSKLKINARFIGTFFGHTLKSIEGRMSKHPDFTYEKVYGIFNYLAKNNIEPIYAKRMLPIVFEHPSMDFESILTILKFKKRTKQELLAPIDFLKEKFKDIRISKNEGVTANWLMGQIHSQAIGNVSLKELFEEIKKEL